MCGRGWTLLLDEAAQLRTMTVADFLDREWMRNVHDALTNIVTSAKKVFLVQYRICNEDVNYYLDM